jgi:hypothetical protein
MTACLHNHLVRETTGSRWNTPDGPDDNIETAWVCLDCLKTFSEYGESENG